VLARGVKIPGFDPLTPPEIAFNLVFSAYTTIIYPDGSTHGANLSLFMVQMGDLAIFTGSEGLHGEGEVPNFNFGPLTPRDSFHPGFFLLKPPLLTPMEVYKMQITPCAFHKWANWALARGEGSMHGGNLLLKSIYLETCSRHKLLVSIFEKPIVDIVLWHNNSFHLHPFISNQGKT
jgi:hypothetical protein